MLVDEGVEFLHVPLREARRYSEGHAPHMDVSSEAEAANARALTERLIELRSWRSPRSRFARSSNYAWRWGHFMAVSQTPCRPQIWYGRGQSALDLQTTMQRSLHRVPDGHSESASQGGEQ